MFMHLCNSVAWTTSWKLYFRLLFASSPTECTNSFPLCCFRFICIEACANKQFQLSFWSGKVSLDCFCHEWRFAWWGFMNKILSLNDGRKAVRRFVNWYCDGNFYLSFTDVIETNAFCFLISRKSSLRSRSFPPSPRKVFFGKDLLLSSLWLNIDADRHCGGI